MWQNPLLLLFLAVVVAGGIACPVQGDTLSGEEVWRSGIGDRVVEVTLSQDGRTGAAITGDRVYFFDQNGTTLWSYPVSRGRSVAISTDGERIAAGGDQFLLFDQDGEVLWHHAPTSRIQGVAIAADGRTAYAGAGTDLLAFSLDEGRSAANTSWSSDIEDHICSISIDGEGSSIIAGGDSGDIYFYHGDGQLLWRYRTGSSGIRVAISHDGSTVAAASPKRVIFLLNRHGRLLWKSPTDEAVTDVSLSGDGSTLAVADGGITVFNRDGEVVWRCMTGEETRCVSLSPDTNGIIAGALDGTVSVFRLRSETIPAGASATSTPDTTFIIEPPPSPGETSAEQGAALAPAAPVAAGAWLAAQTWWRRKER
jgi:outer membrane protein assembly factor BamB